MGLSLQRLWQAWDEFLCWALWHRHVVPPNGRFVSRCTRCGEHISEHLD